MHVAIVASRLRILTETRSFTFGAGEFLRLATGVIHKNGLLASCRIRHLFPNRSGTTDPQNIPTRFRFVYAYIITIAINDGLGQTVIVIKRYSQMTEINHFLTGLCKVPIIPCWATSTPQLTPLLLVHIILCLLLISIKATAIDCVANKVKRNCNRNCQKRNVKLRAAL
ncbi:hypothetical protein POJ06DRAFT_74154 [Lipomyces tetrasporus]|uniref:Uncharacterized protein n=1 Tax=Lipomyces tetrasporus TaxID=54092 RepID=A0AAD7QV92_9ASCO|nr:uncharacterized protein POJ06DRAFT_74154 [Lipomyces tetrasporus]KAJ8101943.1 hypothetical protein POJ06DRAFT_74154 [Lipomyces tetrasporus]